MTANYQTGRESHLDCMLNQFLSETFAIGLRLNFLNAGISGEFHQFTLLVYKVEMLILIVR